MDSDLLNKILRILARREYSYAELFRKYTQQYDADTVDETLTYAAEKGYQSDDRFTAQFIDARAGRAYGPRKISYELQHQHDITVSASDFAHIDFRDVACRYLEKKFGQIGDQATREKAYRALSQKGFDHDTIKDALAAKEVLAFK